MDPGSPPQPERYASLTEAGTLAGFRLGALVATVLFAAGSVLDVATQPQAIVPLSAIRLVTTALFLGLWLFARRGRFPFPARPTAFAGLTIAGVAVTAMCVVTGGWSSPYYGGMNLVVLAAGVLFPWGWRRTLGASATLVALWVVGTLLLTPPGTASKKVLANNLYFLLSSALVSVASAGWHERTRRQSYERLLAAEEAQARIDRSREALQSELTVRKGSLEELAAEVTRQRHELHEALQEAERARAQAERALRARDEFLSVASHELRSPLMGLRLQLEVAKRAGALEGDHRARVQRSVEVAITQTERLGRLVDDMLDVSRLSSGRLTMNLQPVRLDELVRGVTERCQAVLAEARCELHVAVPDRIEGVWDPLRLEQALENLLSNAAKYGAGRPVHVEASRVADEVWLSVRDEGCGIPADEQDRIFEPFERSSLTGRIRGLGLGLYIVRQIVEAHGGHVEVSSEPQRGATFLLVLPLHARPAQGVPVTA